MSNVIAGWYDDGTGRQRWWDGSAWTDHFAPVQAVAPYTLKPETTVVVNGRKAYKTSHGFHLFMSIITLGLWLPVWLIVGIYNAARA